ncbi:MAG: patatin-like phospholipase family protein [bacterium]
MRKLRFGLALGGGGARGLAHIGVLKVLEEAGISINVIAGTSSGALIGALYACGYNASSIEKKSLEFLESSEYKRARLEFLKDEIAEESSKPIKKIISYAKWKLIYNLSLVKLALVSEKRVKTIVNSILPNKNIEDLRIPFVCVSTDLTSNRELCFTKGPLREAVRASITIPGLFPPLKWEGRRLVDGGAVNLVPVDPAFKLGADLVVGVDVHGSFPRSSHQEMKTGLDVILRTSYISGLFLNELRLRKADLVIRPDVGNIHWVNFKKLDYCIKKGEESTRAKLREIYKLMRKRRTETLWKRLWEPQ